MSALELDPIHARLYGGLSDQRFLEKCCDQRFSNMVHTMVQLKKIRVSKLHYLKEVSPKTSFLSFETQFFFFFFAEVSHFFLSFKTFSCEGSFEHRFELSQECPARMSHKSVPQERF